MSFVRMARVPPHRHKHIIRAEVFETRRHYPNHRKCVPGKVDRLPDDRGIRTKAATPQAVSQDYHWCTRRTVFRCRESAPSRWRSANHPKEIRGDNQARDVLI